MRGGFRPDEVRRVTHDGQVRAIEPVRPGRAVPRPARLLVEPTSPCVCLEDPQRGPAEPAPAQGIVGTGEEVPSHPGAGDLGPHIDREDLAHPGRLGVVRLAEGREPHETVVVFLGDHESPTGHGRRHGFPPHLLAVLDRDPIKEFLWDQALVRPAPGRHVNLRHRTRVARVPFPDVHELSPRDPLADGAGRTGTPR
jgi:hypothetical protein